MLQNKIRPAAEVKLLFFFSASVVEVDFKEFINKRDNLLHQMGSNTVGAVNSEFVLIIFRFSIDEPHETQKGIYESLYVVCYGWA